MHQLKLDCFNRDVPSDAVPDEGSLKGTNIEVNVFFIMGLRWQVSSTLNFKQSSRRGYSCYQGIVMECRYFLKLYFSFFWFPIRGSDMVVWYLALRLIFFIFYLKLLQGDGGRSHVNFVKCHGALLFSWETPCPLRCKRVCIDKSRGGPDGW